MNTDECWTNSAYSEKPLSLSGLSKAYNLLSQEKPPYDLIVVPKGFVKQIDFISNTSQCLWGMPIIIRPEAKRKGLFRWRLFWLLFSSTENIIKEWHWNRQVFLLSKQRLAQEMVSASS